MLTLNDLDFFFHKFTNVQLSNSSKFFLLILTLFFVRSYWHSWRHIREKQEFAFFHNTPTIRTVANWSYRHNWSYCHHHRWCCYSQMQASPSTPISLLCIVHYKFLLQTRWRILIQTQSDFASSCYVAQRNFSFRSFTADVSWLLYCTNVKKSNTFSIRSSALSERKFVVFWKLNFCSLFNRK